MAVRENTHFFIMLRTAKGRPYTKQRIIAHKNLTRAFVFIGGKIMLDILAVNNYNIITGIKEVSMPKKQLGRPFSDDPKNYRIDVRLTKDEITLLDKYCNQKGVSRPQGLRDGIKALTKK